MFRSIVADWDKNADCQCYHLIDTLFETSILAPRNLDSKLSTVMPEITIIRAYQARKLNITRSLVAYYKQILASPVYRMSHIDTWREYIELYAPELEYSKKYYNCVINQLKGYRYEQKNFR